METEAQIGTCLKCLIHASSSPSSEPCSGWADDGQGGCQLHHSVTTKTPAGSVPPRLTATFRKTNSGGDDAIPPGTTFSSSVFMKAWVLEDLPCA